MPVWRRTFQYTIGSKPLKKRHLHPYPYELLLGQIPCKKGTAVLIDVHGVSTRWSVACDVHDDDDRVYLAIKAELTHGCGSCHVQGEKRRIKSLKHRNFSPIIKLFLSFPFACQFYSGLFTCPSKTTGFEQKWHKFFHLSRYFS